jgi:DNA-binding MarR family transcriptional regulator
MPNTVEENAGVVLQALAEQPRDQWIDAKKIAEVTGLSPSELNDAITILVDAGLAEWLRVMGTAPFNFRSAWITPRGRYEYERLTQQQATNTMSNTQTFRPPSPVGSPYGFSDEDWETVSERKAAIENLYVVLGYQFISEHYDSGELSKNIEAMFLNTVNEYNKLPGSTSVNLSFRPLSAGYGEHLFNEIARDIIASDIAVFETSNLNPNVMIEMGVALTWGVRVLPIKKEGCPRPPSDISGQTWADYQDNASLFIDPDHNRKLLRMVERAIRKKGHT